MSQSEAFQGSTTSSQAVLPRVRFDYLDGLRGLAALYVVLFHIYLDCGQLREAVIPQILKIPVRALLSHGSAAVGIFIVLSGYCLMLPVARSLNGQIKGSTLNFLKRRARRILPPYYAALVLAILLNLAIPAQLILRMGSHWNSGQPALTSGAIFSHVLLIHNLNHNWAHRINPPMWSVALEWQIYFLFPLLLVPIWRRLGTAVILVVTCLFPLIFPGNEGDSFYVTLFTLGMLGAIIGFYREPSLPFYKERLPWGRVSILFGIIWFVVAVIHPIGTVAKGDLLLGPAVACWMIECSRSIVEGKSNLVLRLFELPQAIALGTFSYSLYLTHAMVLAVVELCLSGISMAPLVKFSVLVAIVLPLSLLFAYLFHLIFEKPFMSSPAVKALKEKQE